MIALPAAKPGAVTPAFTVFWTMLGRVVAALAASKSHADVVIIIKDGTVQRVCLNQSFLPGNLPQVMP